MREVERNGDSLKRGGAKLLARMLPRMLDKTSTNPIATGSLVQRTANIEGVMDPELSLTACQRATGNVVWTPEKLLDLPGAAEESSFLEDVRPTIQLTLQPYQHAQASLFAGVGGVGLSSAEARRMSMSVGSLVATVSEALADMSGAIGDKVRRDLPDSDLVPGAFGTASGTSAMFMGFQRKPWRTSCRTAGRKEPFEKGEQVASGE